MAIEAANQYLDKNKRGALDAFNVPKMRFAGIFSTPEQFDKLYLRDRRLMFEIGHDFLCAGLGYLANHNPDRLFQDLGETAWKEFDKRTAAPIFTNDVPNYLLQLGFQLDHSLLSEDPEAPFVVIAQITQGKQVESHATALIHTRFPVDAIYRPLDALAQLVFVTSGIRDSANKRGIVEDHRTILERAAAMQAKFLRDVLRKNPKAEVSAKYRKRMILYPEIALKLLLY